MRPKTETTRLNRLQTRMSRFFDYMHGEFLRAQWSTTKHCELFTNSQNMNVEHRVHIERLPTLYNIFQLKFY